MGVRARREQEKRERRERILNAAEQIFFTKGAERSTMDDIARAAQLSRGLLYVYFRDKSAILEAVMLRAAEALRCRFRTLAATDLCGHDQILAMGEAYYTFSLEQPDYFDLLTRAASDWPTLPPETSQQMLATCSGEVMAIMADAIRRGVSDGSLAANQIRDPVQTALYLRGALHGVIMLTRQPDGLGLPAGQNAAALVHYTLETLGASLRSTPTDN